MLELDPTGSGTIDYFGFLSAVFLTQMYLKELTLAKDAQGWRIVAERTLKKL